MPFLVDCYNSASEAITAYKRGVEEIAERARQERAAALESLRLQRLREEEEREERLQRERAAAFESLRLQRPLFSQVFKISFAVMYAFLVDCYNSASEAITAYKRGLEEIAERERQERAAALESLRLQRLLEEQARQELEERQRREQEVRIQAERAQAKIERIRRKAREEKKRKKQVLKDAKNELAEGIDFYIRTRRRFDSRIPLAFLCDISSVAQDPAVIASLADVNLHSVDAGYDETSLREFIEGNKSFVLQCNKIGVRHLTPFQGATTHRVYGYFRCFSCKRDWQSAATYTNKWQKCQACEGKCYPYEQHVLETSQQQSDNLRPHDTGRCQRCIELGQLCLNFAID